MTLIVLINKFHINHLRSSGSTKKNIVIKIKKEHIRLKKNGILKIRNMLVKNPENGMNKIKSVPAIEGKNIAKKMMK